MRQEPPVTDASTEIPVRTGWFEAARFGLFVHFDLYSLAARHEWVRSRETKSQQQYDRYPQKFNPDLFDAPQLAHTAKAFWSTTGSASRAIT
jgi:alpha-L-fucosidase